MTTRPSPSAALWWHLYGRVEPEGAPFAGAWRMVVIGESTVAPGEPTLDDKTPETADIDGLPYLGSFDHEPTDAEKNTLTPEQFHD